MEMQEQSGVEFVKPSEETIRGVLVAIELKETAGGSMQVCTVEEREGENMEYLTGRILEFPYLTDLQNKMKRHAIGHGVEISYLGESSKYGREGRSMQEYRVRISKGKVPAGKSQSGGPRGF